jgi:uncharacterized protein (TIGR03437 family)
LDRLRITIFAAVLMGLICVPMASAQTAANITVQSGNGQIICETCSNTNVFFFLPMVVRVTDASGKPIPNKTVTWNITSLFQGQVATLNFGPFTQTDANGITSNTLAQAATGGSAVLAFLQTTVTASADAAPQAIFTETQALSDTLNNLVELVQIGVTSPAQGTTLTGTAGAPGTSPILVHVAALGTGTPVPGASVRLLNGIDPTVGASAACQTGPGADIGSVLTDANGNASCTPIFGGIAGQGSISILVGAVDATPTSGTPTPVAFFQSFGISIVTTVAVPGSISITAGNLQSANPGQPLGIPLAVRVADTTGTTGISGATVVWTVSPAGAATFSPASGPTNSQGLASTVVTLSNLASGTVRVTAALTGANSGIATTFSINVVIIVTVAGVTKVSGDSQTAIEGAPFAQPLVVQVSVTAGGLANIPVSFSVNGPASIGGVASTGINSDSAGRAQVTVTAGSTAGTVTVTATAGGFSQSFTLTVVPPGPSLTAGSFFNAAGLKPGSMSPCSLVTISASGLAPGVQGTLNPASLFGPLPLSLGPDKVTFNNIPAPILRISNNGSQEQITVQVPCEVSPGSSVPVTVTAAGGSSTVNVAIQPASPGIFETVMSDGVSRAVMVRPDGSFVSLENPARSANGGEIIRVYVTGLGPTAPAVGTNTIPIPVTDSLVLGLVIVGVNNSGARVISARAAPTQIGIYEVAFQVDSSTPSGNNIILSVAVNPVDGSPTQFSNGSKIPIQ